MAKREKRYFFQIELSGVGKTADLAWENAVEAFACDPGCYDLAYTEEEKIIKDKNQDKYKRQLERIINNLVRCAGLDKIQKKIVKSIV